MSRLTRRQFVQTSLVAGAGIAIGGTRSSGAVVGSNDTIRVAIAGINGRGKSHVSELLEQKGVQIVGLVDVDSRTFPSQVKEIKDRTGVEPKLFRDVREALDDPNIDALTIATPNHWHALMTIWACQAGKDVYVEKPCSHNVREGRMAVEVARKHQRIVQHGTQGRSSGSWAKVAEIVKSGQLGKLLVSRGLCYKKRDSIGFKKETNPPAEVDFNLWLGPAAEMAYHANLVPYNWHWFWELGNGDIGNQGVHQMDIARWMIPGATLPKSVASVGGRFGYEDQGETPNTQVTVMDFGDTQLIFEVRGRPCEKYHGEMVGNILHFEEGIIAGERFYAKGSKTPGPLPKVEATRGPGKGHFGNFIEAVRTREQTALNADILEGHYSSTLCHLANISYRLGEATAFEPHAAEFDKGASLETLTRMEEHLMHDVKLNLKDQKLKVGRKLVVDATKEAFVNDPAADKLLTREYRQPFAVPEKLV